MQFNAAALKSDAARPASRRSPTSAKFASKTLSRVFPWIQDVYTPAGVGAHEGNANKLLRALSRSTHFTKEPPVRTIHLERFSLPDPIAAQAISCRDTSSIAMTLSLASAAYGGRLHPRRHRSSAWLRLAGEQGSLWVAEGSSTSNFVQRWARTAACGG